MSTKHTPGPWVWHNGQIISRPTGARVMVPFAYSNSDDGELMAAAPELLQFAQYVLSLKTGGQIEGRAREIVARATGEIIIDTDDPDLLWHADHADEPAAEHADDLAERHADGMENDTSWTFPVLCYRQMPDRRMKITLSQGEDRIMRWEWVPIADGADHD